MTTTAEVLVVGAGIAGVSATYRLAVDEGLDQVLLVDPLSPLTLTSDKSTECYRNWWPSRSMVGLMNRSIDLLEEMATRSGNAFGLNRRGYLFATSDRKRLEQMMEQARATSSFGAGPVRVHPGDDPYPASPEHGFEGAAEGTDVLVGPHAVRHRFPYLSDRTVGAVHVRRAGWFSAQQLGAWMLEQARERGARLVADRVTGIRVEAGAVRGVSLASGAAIDCAVVVDAAGPMAGPVAAMAGVELPLFSELHLKVAYRDHLGAVPRDAPMLIWSDPQVIPWSDEERAALAAEGRDDLLGEMPEFCHGRPEGGGDSPYLLALWEYHREVLEPVWPLPEDPLYPEVVMRGLATMVPGLASYLDRMPHATVDGGYYTKTAENRPLIGPAGPSGFHVIAGLSGFGVMVAAGAADLLARHVMGGELPHYAADFLLSRYQDPNYPESASRAAPTGQL